VHAAGTVTPYLRAGTGQIVVMLGQPGHAVLDPLLGILAESHRVVVPDLSCPKRQDGTKAVAFSSWLRAFLDGLGAIDASIVAWDGLALGALAFALSDSERVRRLVLRFPDVPDPLDERVALTEQLEAARCRLLVVREEPSSDIHLRLISEFIGA
jgi:pimeloyl-ACP methyl ester carboxylesterase